VRLPDGLRSRAVLLGTSQYVDPNLPPLPAVRNNLSDLAAVLTSPDGTGLPVEHCAVLPDQTDVEVLGAQLETVAAQAQDLLLVYYAGHGLVDAKGKLYLALPRTRRDQLRWTGLPFSHVQDVILDSPAANRVLILDCCFAGRAIEAMSDPQSVVSGQIEIAGTYTLTSTSANAVSHAPKDARHTAFTGQLLDVLRSGTADQDELLTLSVIYRNLLRSLASHGMPRPEQRGTLTADLLALAPNRRTTALVLRAEYERFLLTPQQVRDELFGKPAEGAKGYNEDEVDNFLDLVEVQLALPIEQASELTPEDVHNVAFTSPAAGKRGYREDDVDTFLDQVEEEVARRRALHLRWKALGRG